MGRLGDIIDRRVGQPLLKRLNQASVFESQAKRAISDIKWYLSSSPSRDSYDTREANLLFARAMALLNNMIAGISTGRIKPRSELANHLYRELAPFKDYREMVRSIDINQFEYDIAAEAEKIEMLALKRERAAELAQVAQSRRKQLVYSTAATLAMAAGVLFSDNAQSPAQALARTH